MSSARLIRASIGFAGGQVLAVRVALAQIAYVRVDSDEPRVGFGA